MAVTFAERIGELRHRTDMGTALHGQVVMDQVYAHYQHERLELRHPRGGIARYLSTALYEHYGDYLRDVAHDWLQDGGKRAMARSMEHLSDEAERLAPWEFVDLARSGSPSVRIGQNTYYERPPKQHRLTERELRIKARLRPMPKQLIGWIWWHVMHMQSPPPRRAS